VRGVRCEVCVCVSYVVCVVWCVRVREREKERKRERVCGVVCVVERRDYQCLKEGDGTSWSCFLIVAS
jgi:hypothetical protein